MRKPLGIGSNVFCFSRMMRRVHQSDDSRVHAACEVGGEMRDAMALTEFRQLRNGRNRGSIHLPVRQAGRAALGVCEIYPHIAVALFTEEAARIDAVALKLGIRSDRGHLAALARVCVKSP